MTCAHRYVIGAATTADWRALDLAGHKVLAVMNGVMVREGVGSNVLGDPRVALTWLANELSRHGMQLAPARPSSRAPVSRRLRSLRATGWTVTLVY